MNLNERTIIKNNIFFSLPDVLISGPVNKNLSKLKISKLFKFLKPLENDGLISLYLLVGQDEKKVIKKIKEHGIDKFFKKENMFFVTQEYIKEKEEIDRERHLANLDKDPDFVDEFFKQRMLMDFVAEGKITRENSALICHDIWFDGFYCMRFSGADFFIVNESVSERNQELPENIAGLNYVKLNDADFKKILTDKFPRPDLRFLETYIFNKLKLELFEGTKIDSLVKKSVIGKKPN
tara:strand:+ start:852 stop:1562 length:711 start_codon:yes stop_codon:yes gene_type:complete